MYGIDDSSTRSVILAVWTGKFVLEVGGFSGPSVHTPIFNGSVASTLCTLFDTSIHDSRMIFDAGTLVAFENEQRIFVIL
jgi:hypothetical protein